MNQYGTLASDAKFKAQDDAATSTDARRSCPTCPNQLAALNTNSTVAMSGNKAIFTAVAGADSRAVFNLNGALGTTVFGATEFESSTSAAPRIASSTPT